MIQVEPINKCDKWP